jgi:uncharacterized protein (TIGR02466 family)
MEKRFTKMKVYDEQLFPVTIAYSDHKLELENSVALVNLSKKIIDGNKDTPFMSPCISTVYKKTDILELVEFLEVKKQVLETIKHYTEINRIDTTDLIIYGSWLNYYDVGGYQDLHHHPKSVLSGVYYIQSDGERDFAFQNPSHFFQPVPPNFYELNELNFSNVLYESIVGRCIVFPAHLMHKTSPAKSPRISLSFNASYRI